MAILEADLAKERPDLMEVYDLGKIGLLHTFMKGQLGRLVESLTAGVRAGADVAGVEAQVLRVVKAQRRLNGNHTYLR